MKPVILFRSSLAEEGETEIASKYFSVVESVLNIEVDSLIIPRYSLLPYPEELEQNAIILNSKLINTISQSRYLSHMPYWYHDLKQYTPRTWFNIYEAKQEGAISFVIKGNTNSRKNLWRTHMFCPTLNDIDKVYNNLLDDPLISEQGIVIREYEKFKSYGEGINGAPITKEFRIFMYKDKVLAKGFYWASHPEVVEEHKPNANEIPNELISGVAAIVKEWANFWVMDVAEREDGQYRLIELNDGTQSGLSCVDPDELYSNLAKVLDE